MRKLAEAFVGVLVLLFLSSGLVYAKLPPPTEEQKKAAEEKKEKDAAGAKKAAEELAKLEDRIAEHYIKDMKAKGITMKPTPIPPPAPAAAPAPATHAASTDKNKK
ncbi:MAG: hypothetical protein ACREUY_10735 [Burkholderiales bacterium]